jgi:glycosyltransferase involved in cell wall biosynthesis
MLGKGGPRDVLGFGGKLWRETRRRKPAIVHGYMPVANELALIAGRGARSKVVWGIRSSYVAFQPYGAFSKPLFWSGRILSRLPDLMIVNSFAGREHHRKAGYDASKMVVIPNGIDSARFRPDVVARMRVRMEWDIPDGAPLIGIVGRVEPMKGYATFLKAAGFVGQRSHAHFVCIGGGTAAYRREMEAVALAEGCGRRVHWLGACNDMPSAYAALDVLVSASLGEGFSNVIGEAMASGVRCVVTDVGDSARIVGDTGIVVPAGDANKMARAILDILDGDCQPLGNPRDQVSENFSRERMVTTTAAALESLV